MLQVRLLGQFDVRADGRRVILSSRTGQSLFAYLALTAGTSHRREKLAGMIWPDTPDEGARKYLRQELWRIRKAISAAQPVAREYLLADELTLGFNPAADYWLDASQLERSGSDLQSLSSDVSLYQGELLPGFYDDWVLLERERLHAVFESRMEQLVAQLVGAERWGAVQEQSERWLALGDAPEPAYRALMLVHAARGDMPAVTSIYQRCVDTLREQFGVEPSAETHALYNGLLKGSAVQRRVVQAKPSGTVTFLFTDIEGSTRLLDQLGERYAEVLAGHHEILRRVVQKWNGREVDTQGDAFFITFARALDAVQCAAEAQRLLAEHTWPLDKPVRVRMGLHTGEPLIASTGYVGMDVHRAARIGDSGHGGQILLSQSTRELVIHDLPPGLGIRDLGEHRLKDMKYPAPIYQLEIEGLPQDFPPLKTKFSGTEAPAPGEPPFKGLQYFEEADSALYFGRELLTARLADRLCEPERRLLSVIVGASGSGKSSLVRAGLVPVVKGEQRLPDGMAGSGIGADWRVHILTPTGHPLEALAAELTRDLESITATAGLMDDLAKEPRSLGLFFARSHPGRHALLVIDQFEELFTLCRDEFEREAFIDNLLAAAADSDGSNHVSLIFTLRADFYAHLAQYPELRDAAARQQEYIGPMGGEELRRAIEEPARIGHWEFEPGLVDLILRDIGDEPGALPLLSHALLETWKRRAGHTMTLKGYADAGGVRGAIAHTAEGVYQGLSPEEQEIARDIFLRLTQLGEGTEDTRRRASFEELMSQAEQAEEVRQVLNRLADARLVTLGEGTAEVAHEALIREWPALREWLSQDREGLRLHRHLTEAAHEWELLERDPGALYRGAHLAQAREWAAAQPNALNAGERAFLNASAEQEEREEQERERQQRRELEAAQRLAEEQKRSADRLRLRNRFISGIGAVALVLALLAGMFGIQSSRNAARAQANLGQANEQRALAVNAQATAVTESYIRATQQAIAESNFKRAEAQRLAAEANKLALAGGSPEQIALLSLRSMESQYTPQGDAALAAAANLNYPIRLFSPAAIAVFSPDGRFVLSAEILPSLELGYMARLWDLNTGREVRRFLDSYGRISAVAFSADGRYVLTGSEGYTARVWDTGTGKEVRRLNSTDPGNVKSVAYSPDGRYIATGGADHSARLWDASTGRQLRWCGQFTAPVGSVAFSPDGRYVLATDGTPTVSVCDVETGQVMHQFTGPPGSIANAIFSPDGKLILTGSYDGIARLWDPAAGREVQRFTGHTGNIFGLAFSSDGRYVFTGSHDGTARMWDLQSGRELRRFSSSTSLNNLALSPDDRYLLTAGMDGVARLWQIVPEPELPSFASGIGISALAFSPDGSLVLTGDSNGVARTWDAVSGREVREFIGHTNVIHYGVSFSPDGQYVLTGSGDGTVRLWDGPAGKELRQFDGQTGGVHSVVFSPDGRRVAASTQDGVWLWDAVTGQEVFQLSTGSEIFRVFFSADGKYLLTTGGVGDGSARLWEAATGKIVRHFIGDTNSVMNSAAFSPDGRYILTGSMDGIARLLDMQTGDKVREFIGHTDILWTAAFSPDGKYVATASADHTARLWDAQTGQELRRFAGHSAGVENVAFSPDGKHLLTGSDDGTARLWDVDYHDTIRWLCSRLLRDFTDDERLQYGITDHVPTCPQAQ